MAKRWDYLSNPFGFPDEPNVPKRYQSSGFEDPFNIPLIGSAPSAESARFDEFTWNDPLWSDRQKSLWTDFDDKHSGLVDDRIAQTLFHEAYFNFDIDPNTRAAIRENLDAYLLDEYGVDFESEFDWKAYKEMYESDQ